MAEVAEALESRRSRLWGIVSPADLADWIFAEPVPAPLHPLPVESDDKCANGLTGSKKIAWALAGWAARMVVPEPATTAGRHWHLSYLDDTTPAVLRLTVGVLEIIGLYESGESVWLRLHAGPVGLALEAGVASEKEWEERGIEILEDRTKTLAEEKLLLRCPDLATAFWLLRQRPVIAGMRLLSCWVAAGPYSFESSYHPEVVGRAWLASTSLSSSSAE
ncbi:hypothetical protein ACGFIK_05585 [Micromonospora sp. NPDC048871]|uniref:hypothetical protein n=1 Tax=unclassified Micromonospora TaxID=2617518 RepID=UPI002E13AA67|nr:hypothetical protein OIE53_04790 [Micromonospora sp. NBC_01739]